MRLWENFVSLCKVCDVLIIYFYRSFFYKIRLKKEYIFEKKVFNFKENKFF